MKSCLILDYGVGNIGSLYSFFKSHDYQVSYGNTPNQIEDAGLLIMPGVGSFKEASRNLEAYKLNSPIMERHFAKKPILGVCLGLQLMTHGSEESLGSKGLGIVEGFTRRLPDFSRVGWDSIDSSFCEELSKEFFYFNHSYAIYDECGNSLSANSFSGKYKALIVENTTIGVQFHPEKSQESGAKFLNWAENKVWKLND